VRCAIYQCHLSVSLSAWRCQCQGDPSDEWCISRTDVARPLSAEWHVHLPHILQKPLAESVIAWRFLAQLNEVEIPRVSFGYTQSDGRSCADLVAFANRVWKVTLWIDRRRHPCYISVRCRASLWGCVRAGAMTYTLVPTRRKTIASSVTRAQACT
jgi:hypothetical protein